MNSLIQSWYNHHTTKSQFKLSYIHIILVGSNGLLGKPRPPIMLCFLTQKTSDQGEMQLLNYYAVWIKEPIQALLACLLDIQPRPGHDRVYWTYWTYGIIGHWNRLSFIGKILVRHNQPKVDLFLIFYSNPSDLLLISTRLKMVIQNNPNLIKMILNVPQAISCAFSLPLTLFFCNSQCKNVKNKINIS